METSSCSRARCLRIFIGALLVSLIFHLIVRKSNSKAYHLFTHQPALQTASSLPSLQLLHMGNSIQYVNDAPHVLHQMLQDSRLFGSITHEVCLRGGSNLVTLYKYGTTWYRRAVGGDYGADHVQDLFDGSDTADHRMAIFNDFTQAPARNKTRKASLEALQKEYLPLLQKQTNTTPIFIQTAAYRENYAYDTEDIGDFDAFTEALREGYLDYKVHLRRWTHQPAYVAPMGDAYQYLRNHNRSVWRNLYVDDDKHPSPQGTLLQAYLLYLTILHHLDPSMDMHAAIPQYNPHWFHNYFPHRIVDPPTLPQAKKLRDVAILMFQQQQQRQEKGQ